MMMEIFIFFINEGTASAPNFGAPLLNPFGLNQTGILNVFTFSDLDMDGDFDIFSGNADENFLYFENTGNQTVPNYAVPIENPFGLVTVSNAYTSIPNISLTDLDADGDTDLFVCGSNINKSSYFRNNTAQNNDPLAPFAGGDVVIPLDYDGVTDVDPLDLLVVNPCGPDLPFDGITADVNQVDASDINLPPVAIRVFITVGDETITRNSMMTVVDLLKPVIVPIPDIDGEANEGDNFTSLPDFSTLINASDNSGAFTITQEPIIGTEVPLNTTITVTVGAVDSSGNETESETQFTAVPFLGIEDSILDATITLYPNPANTSITLLNESTEIIQKIQFLDITGKVVKEVDLNNNASETSLDISPLASGLYMVKIVGASTSTFKQIIKK